MKTLDENQLQGICRTCGRKYRCKDALRYLDMQGCNQYEVLTNEEWLNNLNTEEKAKWLSQRSQILYDCGQRDVFPKIMYEEDWEWWLKQPHKENG